MCQWHVMNDDPPKGKPGYAAGTMDDPSRVIRVRSPEGQDGWGYYDQSVEAYYISEEKPRDYDLIHNPYGVLIPPIMRMYLDWSVGWLWREVEQGDLYDGQTS